MGGLLLLLIVGGAVLAGRRSVSPAGTAPAAAAPTAGGLSTWDPAQIYAPGDRVSHSGGRWQWIGPDLGLSRTVQGVPPPGAGWARIVDASAPTAAPPPTSGPLSNHRAAYLLQATRGAYESAVAHGRPGWTSRAALDRTQRLIELAALGERSAEEAEEAAAAYLRGAMG